MKADEAIDSFLWERAKRLQFPALFHARISTHGVNTVENCHPFRIGKAKHVAIAHNGILPCEPGPFDIRSDSRFFAEDILPAQGGFMSLISDRVEWERWMGWQNKIVAIGSVRGTPSMVILNRIMGDFDEGIWWSNRSYKRVATYRTTSWYTGTSRWPQCEVCGTKCESVTTVEDVDLCTDCHKMLDPESYWPTREACECEGCGDLLPKDALTLHRNEMLCSACLPITWEQRLGTLPQLTRGRTFGLLDQDPLAM